MSLGHSASTIFLALFKMDDAKLIANLASSSWRIKPVLKLGITNNFWLSYFSLLLFAGSLLGLAAMKKIEKVFVSNASRCCCSMAWWAP